MRGWSRRSSGFRDAEGDEEREKYEREVELAELLAANAG